MVRIVKERDPEETPPGSPTNSRTKPDDLSTWVLATAPKAVAYATSLLRDREKAEDVVQDCFCRLLAKAAVYDLQADGLKLLLRSISNACINLKARHRGVFSIFGKDDRPPELSDPSVREPGQNLLDRELNDQIGRGLASLPVLQRAAIELKSLGHSQQDVAEILGVKGSYAGVLIHRGRAAMEAFLAPYLKDCEP